MSASPVVLTQKAIYLNADTLQHTASNLRRVTDTLTGVGVLDLNSFRVRQKVSGAAGSVDVTDAATVSQAYVRGSSVNLQGLYLLHNVHQSTGAIDAIYNVDIAAGDATNPRIDQVFLCVEDAQHAGANNQATIRVVAGTPTGGATLDNRTGVGATPAGMSSILLADVLQPAATTNVVTANIRDRRPVALIGTVPWLGSTGTQIDQVSFEPAFAQVVASGAAGNTLTNIAATVHDSMQAAALMYLPRRQAATIRFKWKYQQGTTANAGNYVLFIADASGRVIGASGVTAFIGAANQSAFADVVVASATWEAGYYYVGIGIGAMTAASTVYYNGCVTGVVNGQATVGASARNVSWRSATGGTTAPTTILAFTDTSTLAAATVSPMVPVLTLGTG